MVFFDVSVWGWLFVCRFGLGLCMLGWVLFALVSWGLPTVDYFGVDCALSCVWWVAVHGLATLVGVPCWF